jgi:hypothetical protein
MSEISSYWSNPTDIKWTPKGGSWGSTDTSKYWDSTGGGFGGAKKTDWGNVARFAGEALSKYNRDKYNPEDYGGFSGGFVPGQFGGGSGGKILDNLGVMYPQQMSPTFIPGAQAPRKSGLGSTIGSLAGSIGGLLIGGPAGMSVGGTLGGGAGSFFD